MAGSCLDPIKNLDGSMRNPRTCKDIYEEESKKLYEVGLGFLRPVFLNDQGVDCSCCENYATCAHSSILPKSKSPICERVKDIFDRIIVVEKNFGRTGLCYRAVREIWNTCKCEHHLFCPIFADFKKDFEALVAEKVTNWKDRIDSDYNEYESVSTEAEELAMVIKVLELESEFGYAIAFRDTTMIVMRLAKSGAIFVSQNLEQPRLEVQFVKVYDM